MKNCFNCGALLFENARFCHDCGSRTLVEEISCIHCNKPNPMGAKFCIECGNSLFEKKKEETTQDDLFTNTPPPPDEEPQPKGSTMANAAEIWQLKQSFFDALKNRVEEEHHPAEYTSYVNRLQDSGFHEVLDINARRIYEAIEQKRKAKDPQFKLESYKHVAFEDLLDQFIIQHCQDLNPIPLPEKILKYQSMESPEIFDMVLDYLDLEEEPEPTYLDFIKMPLKKLENASKHFIKSEKDEKIYFICDQSIAGSCKEGFAMTDKALYWRAHLLKAQRVDYRHIISVTREKDWILINDQFFNVNPSLNLKMMKLLKKLQRTVL